METGQRTRPGTCVWCGHHRVNREDVLAKWIGRSLQQLVPAHETTLHDLSATIPLDTGGAASPTRMKVRKIGSANGPKRFIVCPTCNGGWMSQLENAVKPVMEPLMLGTHLPEQVDLDSGSLRILATWMTKTAMVMDCSEDTPPLIPQAARTAFFESPSPFKGARIWFAGFNPDYGHLTFRHCLKVQRASPDGTPTDRVILATIGLGYLVLQYTMTILQDGILGNPQRRPAPNQLCSEIWPAIERSIWPPPLMLDGDIIDDFVVPIGARPTAGVR